MKRVIDLCAGIICVIAASGIGFSCQPIPPEKNATNGLIIVNRQAVFMQVDTVYDINVGCPVGQQLVGGGYNLPNPTDVNKYFITADYPSDPNTWTVEVIAHSTNDKSANTIGVYAYCYTGSQNLAMAIQKSTNSSPESVQNAATNTVLADAGSVVTSGGYKLNLKIPRNINEERLIGEYPSFDPTSGMVNGWATTNYWSGDQSESIQTFVMFSKAQPAVFQTTSVTATQNSLQGISSIDTLHTQIACNDGYFTTGGGYKYLLATDQVNGPTQWFFGRSVYMNQADLNVNQDEFAGWEVQALMYNGQGNTIPIQVFAVQLKASQ